MAQMKYYYELTISSSPHVHSPVTTTTIMRDVVIALMPALVGSVYFFGFRALAVTLLSVAACLFFEWLWCRLRKTTLRLHDLTAVVTGILLAFVLPPTIPYWIVIVGAAFSILLVKMLFGGIGMNIVNPALAGRAFLFSWPVAMSTWVKPGFANAVGLFQDVSPEALDGFTAATPLAAMHQGQLPKVDLMDMFMGNIGGCIGETSVALLLVGFVYLLIRKVITARIPLAFIGTVAVLSFLFPMGNDRLLWTAYQLCGGGLMLGAIFMATDYATSPVTAKGQVIYGIGCGILTVIFRYFGLFPEGVTYAILLMNALVWIIDRYTAPRRFGVKKGGK